MGHFQKKNARQTPCRIREEGSFACWLPHPRSRRTRHSSLRLPQPTNPHRTRGRSRLHLRQDRTRPRLVFHIHFAIYHRGVMILVAGAELIAAAAGLVAVVELFRVLAS